MKTTSVVSYLLRGCRAFDAINRGPEQGTKRVALIARSLFNSTVNLKKKMEKRPPHIELTANQTRSEELTGNYALHYIIK